MITTIKGIKELGWTKIKISKEGFEGAIKVVKNEKGEEVAILFNSTEAYVVEDSQGLYTAKDLYEGLIKCKEVNIEYSGYIEGVSVLAYVDDEEIGVEYAWYDVERLGLKSVIEEKVGKPLEELSRFVNASVELDYGNTI